MQKQSSNVLPNANQDAYPDKTIQEHYSIFLVPLRHELTWPDLKNKRKSAPFSDCLKACGWEWHPYLMGNSRRFSPDPVITPEVATIHFGNRFAHPFQCSKLKEKGTKQDCGGCPSPEPGVIRDKINIDKEDYIEEPLFFTLRMEKYDGIWLINNDKECLLFEIFWVDLLLLKDGLGILSFKTKLKEFCTRDGEQKIDLTALGSLHRALRGYSSDTICCGRVSGKTEGKGASNCGQAKFWSQKVCGEWLGNGTVLGFDKKKKTGPEKIFLQSQRDAKILSCVQANIDEHDEFLWNRPVADPAVYYKEGYQQAVAGGDWTMTSLGAQNAIIAGYPTVRDLFLFELGTVSNQHTSMGWQGSGRGWQYSVEYIRNILENNLVEVWEYWSGLGLRDTFSFVAYDESMPISWQAEARYYPLYLITLHLRMRLEVFSREIIDSDLAGYCKGKQIRADLVEFRNHYWFQEVTKDFVGVEVFDKMKKGMKIEELYTQVADEIVEVSEHMQQRFEKGIRWVLVFLLIFFAPIKNLWEKFIIPPIENTLSAHWLLVGGPAAGGAIIFICLLILHKKFQVGWIRRLGNYANRQISNLHPCRFLVK